MPAQMKLLPTRNDQVEAEGLIGGTFPWSGDRATGLTGPSETAASGLGSSTPQMIGFVLLPALRLAQTSFLAFKKLLLRPEALRVKLGPALGRDKQARICFPDCNTGESGRPDSCSLAVLLVVPDKEERGSFQRAAMCAHM